MDTAGPDWIKADELGVEVICVACKKQRPMGIRGEGGADRHHYTADRQQPRFNKSFRSASSRLRDPACEVVWMLSKEGSPKCLDELRLPKKRKIWFQFIWCKGSDILSPFS